MRRIFLILSLFLLVVTAFGQDSNLSVISFYLDETDITANTEGTIVIDQNGNKCALIKIETTQTGFTFDAGILGVVKTIQKTGEIWVYVPQGVKRLKFLTSNLEQYHMTLVCQVRQPGQSLSSRLILTISFQR